MTRGDRTVVGEPTWLATLDPQRMASQPVPIRELLNGSLFYPAARDDGDPVKFLAGAYHSFVYADYDVSRSLLEDTLRDAGFRGYELLAAREVGLDELVAAHHGDCLQPRGAPFWGVTEPAYVVWFVFQRCAAYGDAHGPRRFSLLYCGLEALAVCAAFEANRAAPAVVAVIQTGVSFGGAWTDFRDPTGPFAQALFGNPHGVPATLLYGGCGRHYEEVCWPETHPVRVASWRRYDGGMVGVWQARSDGPDSPPSPGASGRVARGSA